MHSLTHAADVTGWSVVDSAIVEGGVHVINKFLHVRVLVLLHLILYGLEIHGFLDYGGVVVQTQCHWVYWSCEKPRVLLPREVLKYAPCCFFPVRINRVALRHLGHF